MNVARRVRGCAQKTVPSGCVPLLDYIIHALALRLDSGLTYRGLNAQRDVRTCHLIYIFFVNFERRTSESGLTDLDHGLYFVHSFIFDRCLASYR